MSDDDTNNRNDKTKLENFFHMIVHWTRNDTILPVLTEALILSSKWLVSLLS